jgi:mannose-6-phosphate isomerase-like protein (cupin superfamily)
MFRNQIKTFELSQAAIQLRDDGTAEPSTSRGVTDPGAWTVASFHADTDRALHSDVWECHRSGHELLSVLSGAVNVHLRDEGDGDEAVVTLTPREALIVPVGRWHRLTVEEPADLLVITPRAGTRHERMDVGEKAVRGLSC